MGWLAHPSQVQGYIFFLCSQPNSLGHAECSKTVPSAQAVDRPELHSPAYASAALCWDTPFNVVVFSQQGDRPLPNKVGVG